MEMQVEVSRNSQVNEIIMKILRGESALSYSSLSQFRESPKDFIFYKLRQLVQTDAMLYGQMVHCLILQPELFNNRYYVLDDALICETIGGAKPRSTNAYKAWVSERENEAGERTLVKAQDFADAKGVAIGIKNNSAASRILELCPEREVLTEWEYLNYKFKGFIDGKGKSCKFDLKTCTDANPRKVKRDIDNMWYYGQGAMYQVSDDTIGDNYYIIAVDKKGGVSCHQLTKYYLERGRREYEYLVNKFSECILSDSFDSSYEFFADRWDGIYDVNQGW